MEELLMDPLIIFAVGCFLLVYLIPGEVWRMLLWLGALYVVGNITYWSLLLWLTSDSGSL